MESRQFRRADGVLGVGFVQAHTGREVAAIAWPDVEPRRIGLEDLAGHGIELVPLVKAGTWFDEDTNQNIAEQISQLASDVIEQQGGLSQAAAEQFTEAIAGQGEGEKIAPESKLWLPDTSATVQNAITPEEHAELARDPDIDGPALNITEDTKVSYSPDVVITSPAATVIPEEPAPVVAPAAEPTTTVEAVEAAPVAQVAAEVAVETEEPTKLPAE